MEKGMCSTFPDSLIQKILKQKEQQTSIDWGARQAIYRGFDDSMRDANSMIAMRLRLPRGSSLPFEFIASHMAEKKAYVFIVHKGQAVTLEDDADLFPSDKLITSLRVLIG